MAIVDEVSMQQMFQCYHQNWSHVPSIELYIEFEQAVADAVEDVSYVDVERQTVLEEMYSGSEDEFEASYEVPEEEEKEGDEAVDVAVQNASNPLASQHPFSIPSYMRQLDLEALYVHDFLENENIAVAALEDGEFMIGMRYTCKRAVVTTIRQYTLSRGVDYTVYDGRHTCVIGTVSQDHSKLDSDTIADAIQPLVESDPSLKWYGRPETGPEERSFVAYSSEPM
ncbi:hypothetical protein PIB30_054006 [Stylosanthes scabra]|uniref:Uncharacterized protein n=1 Tax=Stylosanthes scabra TaxID=79078 RepID=A0ABU6VIE1_9FABA|nr:hypothetical protein [Stylosanthes scabra]